MIPESFVCKYARRTTDSSLNANADYSVTPGLFDVGPAAGETWYVTRVLITIGDSQSFNGDGYGALATLTNGVGLTVVRGAGDTEVVDLMDGETAKSNAHWDEKCYDGTLPDYPTGTKYAHWRWTFARAGSPIQLKGSRQERLRVTLNDDLTGLDRHVFLFQGERSP